MRNDLLELAGFLLIVSFAFVVWAPSALLVAGVGLLAAAVVDDRRSEPGNSLDEGDR